jgi:uncharacterized protein
MWIIRDLGANLTSLASQYPALCLTGARQTGKTSLMRKSFPQASYVSLDSLPLATNAVERPAEFLDSLKLPVVLDEVQFAPELFRHLKIRIDRERNINGRYLLAGSQQYSLMRGLSESLAGRVAVLELDSLSSLEWKRHRNAAGQNANDLEFIWRGGFPGLWANEALDAVAFYGNYLTTYLERDLRQIVDVGNLRDFDRFVRALAIRNAQLLNYADLARDIGIAQDTARRWVSALEASQLVYLLDPFASNHSKRLVKTPKLYWRDTGLLCFLLGLRSAGALAESAFVGAIWETAVLNQILRARASLGRWRGVYFYRDAHGLELDFILEQIAGLRLVEAKWSETPGASARQPLDKVARALEGAALPEYWIACRTAEPYWSAKDLRVFNGLAWEHWGSSA